MIWERLISWSKTVGMEDVSDDARRWANATLHDAERILSPGGWKEIIALSFEAGRLWERTRKVASDADDSVTARREGA